MAEAKHYTMNCEPGHYTLTLQGNYHKVQPVIEQKAHHFTLNCEMKEVSKESFLVY